MLGHLKIGEKGKAIFVGLSVKDTENRLTIVVLGPCQNVIILYLSSTRMNLCAFSISPIFFLLLLGKSSKKTRIFYGQADRKGGVNPPWPDRSICENFNTFFLWNMIP